MSPGIVAYIERVGSGTIIRRVRLVGPGIVRTFNAPELGGSLSSTDAQGGDAVVSARASARWIADALKSIGLKRLGAICIDADAGVCAWLSSESPDPASVRSTIAQSTIDGDGSGAGMGAARLIALSSTEPSSGLMEDTSIQALATLSTDTQDSAGTAIGQRSRYAVLALPDAPARVILDELDNAGIEVCSSLSIWHALAAAWSTDGHHSTGKSAGPTASLSAAVVLVETSGRLLWAWTRAGQLIAGGSMRLNTGPQAQAQGAALATAQDAPIFVGESSTEQINHPHIDFSKADAGRLAMDWLAWSAQLGHCPVQVICLAPPKLAGEGKGPEILAAHLGRIWPGATIDGAVHEDPIGATLARAAGINRPAESEYTTAQDPADSIAPALRPRELLTELSTRPSRMDRRLYQWIAATVLAAAVLVGALSWKLYASVSQAQNDVITLNKERKDILLQLETSGRVPNLSQSRNPKDDIEQAAGRLSAQLQAIKPAVPVLPELARVLRALKDINAEAADDPLKLTILSELDINSVTGQVKLTVPTGEQGPKVLQRLNAIPGYLNWTGSTTTSSITNGRQYALVAFWPATFPPLPPEEIEAAPTSSSPAPTPAPTTAPAPVASSTPTSSTSPTSTR